MWYIPQETSTALSLLVEGKLTFWTKTMTFYLFKISLIWMSLKQKLVSAGPEEKNYGNQRVVFISLRGVKGSTSNRRSHKWDTYSRSQDFLYKLQYMDITSSFQDLTCLNTLYARWSVGLAACKNIIFTSPMLPPFVCLAVVSPCIRMLNAADAWEVTFYLKYSTTPG